MHRPFAKDHPRRCGENLLQKNCFKKTLGSPPQVRGKPNTDANAAAITRITPAGAGKTAADCDRQGRREDHPRRCGENSITAAVLWVHEGSPPQVRGKHGFELDRPKPYRITPAGAGKTLATEAADRPERDHPRRCGENLTAAWAQQRHGGSPPQVRGKLESQIPELERQGITPAGAGKTVSRKRN